MKKINYKEECLKVFPSLAIKKESGWKINTYSFYVYNASLPENQIKYRTKRAIAVGKTKDEVWENCFKDIEAGRKLGSVMCVVSHGYNDIQYGEVVNVLSIKENNTIICENGETYHYYKREFAPNTEANREVIKKISECEEKEKVIEDEMEKMYGSFNKKVLIIGYGIKGYLVVDENGDIDENGGIEQTDPGTVEYLKRVLTLTHMPFTTVPDTEENRAKMELIKEKEDEHHKIVVERNALYYEIERFKKDE